MEKKAKEKEEQKIIDFVQEDDRDGEWETVKNKKEENQQKKSSQVIKK